MLVAKDLNTHGLLLKLTKPTDPSDQYIEDSVLRIFKLSPTLPNLVQSINEKLVASMTLSRCSVRFLIHFIKGMAVGTGMYLTDYMIVNGQFSRLFHTLAEFFAGKTDVDDVVITHDL